MAADDGITRDTAKDRVTATMQMNHCDVRFLLDTCSDVNTITQRFVHKQQVDSTLNKREIDNVERIEVESSWRDDIDSDKSKNSRKTQCGFCCGKE